MRVEIGRINISRKQHGVAVEIRDRGTPHLRKTDPGWREPKGTVLSFPLLVGDAEPFRSLPEGWSTLFVEVPE